MGEEGAGELKEPGRRGLRGVWLLSLALAIAAVFLVVRLLEDTRPVRDVVASLAASTPIAAASSPTAPVPPTPVSTPTLAPTATFTPQPPPAQSSPTQPPIITREEWGSLELSEGYLPHIVDRITIHHTTGTVQQGGGPAFMRSLQVGSRNRGWVDMPYHYLIDLEGNIYQGRPLQFVGDTATEYDPTGHALISVMGNYDVLEINQAQLEAIVDLASWLSHEYSLPTNLIRGHRDYAATACPGANLYPYLANGYIASAVERRLQLENQ